VGSSSDSSKIGEIPAKFRHVGGTTDLARAQIFIIGECHGLAQCHEANVSLIDAHANDDDIVLIEGVESKRRIPCEKYIQWEEYQCGRSLKSFSKKVQMYGIDNMSEHIKMRELFKSHDEALNHLNAMYKNHNISDIENLNIDNITKHDLNSMLELVKKLGDIKKKMDYTNTERTKSFLKTINYMRQNFPDKNFLFL
jgi:hypothetical protein